MRYKIIFPIDDALHHTAALEDSNLARAIGFARRMSEEDGWWEVVDSNTGNVVASSDSEREEV